MSDSPLITITINETNLFARDSLARRVDTMMMCSSYLHTSYCRYVSATYCTYQGAYSMGGIFCSMGRIFLHTCIGTNSRCPFYIRIFRILGHEHLTFILCGISAQSKMLARYVFQHTYTSNVIFTFTSFDIGTNSYAIYTRISWI